MVTRYVDLAGADDHDSGSRGQEQPRKSKWIVAN
jgi:hypothetical protein